MDFDEPLKPDLLITNEEEWDNSFYAQQNLTNEEIPENVIIAAIDTPIGVLDNVSSFMVDISASNFLMYMYILLNPCLLIVFVVAVCICGVLEKIFFIKGLINAIWLSKECVSDFMVLRVSIIILGFCTNRILLGRHKNDSRSRTIINWVEQCLVVASFIALFVSYENDKAELELCDRGLKLDSVMMLALNGCIFGCFLLINLYFLHASHASNRFPKAVRKFSMRRKEQLLHVRNAVETLPERVEELGSRLDGFLQRGLQGVERGLNRADALARKVMPSVLGKAQQVAEVAVAAEEAHLLETGGATEWTLEALRNDHLPSEDRGGGHHFANLVPYNFLTSKLQKLHALVAMLLSSNVAYVVRGGRSEPEAAPSALMAELETLPEPPRLPLNNHNNN